MIDITGVHRPALLIALLRQIDPVVAQEVEATVVDIFTKRVFQYNAEDPLRYDFSVVGGIALGVNLSRDLVDPTDYNSIIGDDMAFQRALNSVRFDHTVEDVTASPDDEEGTAEVEVPS